MTDNAQGSTFLSEKALKKEIIKTKLIQVLCSVITLVAVIVGVIFDYERIRIADFNIDIFSILILSGLVGGFLSFNRTYTYDSWTFEKPIKYSLIIFLLVYLATLPQSDCYTDWDGRSNPLICD